VKLAERAYFGLCLALGRLLRATRYSTARIVNQDGDPSTSSGSSRTRPRGDPQVRKHRHFYAPLLVWIGGPVSRLLDTGVRVLPQREWEEREHRIYASLRGTSVRVDAGRVLVLPLLAGHTLATLLEDPGLEAAVRKRAIGRAVVALAEFHRLGFTHGDAMAENVLLDLEAGVAHWFDFETLHDSSRPIVWRRADDVRALLATCLVRTVPGQRAETIGIILDVYADADVTRVLAASFTSVWRRSLIFHLAQAPLSFRCFLEIGRRLRERSPRPSGD
jgi:tRNA A-37 threonylcarbamoyl transferase component Bud32